MAAVISEFFMISGIDMTAPATLSELIPWLVTIWVGVVLVSAVFRVFGKLAELFLNWRRF